MAKIRKTTMTLLTPVLCRMFANLLPSDPVINRHSNRDRLLDDSMDRILDWWERAWLRQPEIAERFHIEARSSLPINTDAPDGTPAVYAGLQARRFALRVDQQVSEWYR